MALSVEEIVRDLADKVAELRVAEKDQAALSSDARRKAESHMRHARKHKRKAARAARISKRMGKLIK